MVGDEGDSKLLTIAIPSFNMEDHVGECIASVLSCGERAGALDVIIVDDGSTDATPQIADGLARAHAGIVRCIHKENGHYGSAVNAAMDAATGAYFRILDADDVYDGNALAKLLAFLEAWADAEGAPDMVLTDYVVEHTDEQGLHAQRGREYRATERMRDGDVLPFCETGLETQLMHACTFRTQLLREAGVRLDEHTAFTDEEFCLYPIPCVRTAGYCNAEVYRYRLGRAGQSVDAAELDRTIDQNAFVTGRILDWYETLDLEAIAPGNRAYIAQKVTDVVVTHIRKRMMAKGSAGYKSAVRALDRRVRRLPEINGLIRSRSLKACRLTGYAAWNVMCREMKKRGELLIG